MEAEYTEKKNRIKLRVLTSTGLNLLCTANRSQKVKELLPHIIKLYEEVKEDQGLTDHLSHSSRPFIKFIRKQEFLIAPSQLVGDIFDDNDEVFCEISDDANLNVVTKETKGSKKEKQEKPQTPVKTEVLPPKVKKIKKKNSKQQTDNKKTQANQPKKDEPKKQKQPEKQPSTQQIHIQTENIEINKQLKIDQVQKPLIEGKPSDQSKKKNKKNKNKANQQIKSEEKPAAESIKVETKPQTKPQVSSQQKQQKPKSNVKKSQPSEPKVNTTPLLSNDELAKIRQLMKKSSTVEDN